MASNLNKSMRANYEEFGVEEYYKRVGGASNSYRNPHYPAVKTCIWTWLNLWWRHEIMANAKDSTSPLRLHVFDLAAGSGEATVAVQEWWQAAIPQAAPSDHSGTVPLDRYKSADTSVLSRMPFIPITAHRARLRCEARLTSDDLLQFSACDPYTSEAYTARTGLPCGTMSFRDVSLGQLPSLVSLPSSESESEEQAAVIETDALPAQPSRKYDMIICSFALHLLESSSEVWAILTALSPRAKWLVILEPHKKPEIKFGWGWELWDAENWMLAEFSSTKEILRERVHCRVYRSTSEADDRIGDDDGV